MEGNNMNLEYWMLVALVGLLTWGIMLRRMKSKMGSQLKLPPGPRTWPIVGCLPFLPNLLPRERMLAKLAEKHGELMLLRMGARKLVVASSARMAKEILKTHDHAFANRPNFIAFQYIGFHDTGLSSMSNTSPLFKPTRRMFATEIVPRHKEASSSHVRKEQLLSFLRSAVHDSDAGRHVNFSKAMSSLAMNMALSQCFGRDFDADDTQNLIRTFKKMILLIQRRNIGDSFPAIRRFDVQGIEAGLKEVEVQLRQSITTLIEKKKVEMSMWSPDKIRHGVSDGGIMSKLLSVEGEDRFSDEQLISVVFTLLIAGSDSLARVVTEAMHEVIRNPPIYKRTIAELDAIVGNARVVEETDIPSLPMIQNIIKETLRLHPPTPTLLPHRNFNACEVGGYLIPADSTVLINLYSIMRDPEFWDSPAEFSPDRWNGLRHVKMQGTDFHYTPFGFGERQCPAVVLGTNRVQYTLAMCLQCFHWEVPVGMERRENLATAQEPRKVDDLVLDGKLRVDRRLLDVDA